MGGVAAGGVEDVEDGGVDAEGDAAGSAAVVWQDGVVLVGVAYAEVVAVLEVRAGDEVVGCAALGEGDVFGGGVEWGWVGSGGDAAGFVVESGDDACAAVPAGAQAGFAGDGVDVELSGVDEGLPDGCGEFLLAGFGHWLRQ